MLKKKCSGESGDPTCRFFCEETEEEQAAVGVPKEEESQGASWRKLNENQLIFNKLNSSCIIYYFLVRWQDIYAFTKNQNCEKKDAVSSLHAAVFEFKIPFYASKC